MPPGLALPGQEKKERKPFEDTGSIMPFDTLFLSLYSGPIHPSCVGPVFPDLKNIGERFNLAQTCKSIPIEGGGDWTMTVW